MTTTTQNNTEQAITAATELAFLHVHGTLLNLRELNREFDSINIGYETFDALEVEMKAKAFDELESTVNTIHFHYFDEISETASGNNNGFEKITD
ncbi:hypothetical protein RGQ13_08640 [Thalassotalea psychrophila]|uniref:Uncharacterized protein n=1 Tax=Thalassotalea psychrophila TaxID=3065647 RepID=A0ABY9TZL5_9GAMM|nr:hypothetical protein RGQ13_08640 [Colwelliaceae bacterium SQ149]